VIATDDYALIGLLQWENATFMIQPRRYSTIGSKEHLWGILHLPHALCHYIAHIHVGMIFFYMGKNVILSLYVFMALEANVA
jgi:hypothetical protein